jgi:3-hydroxymyristoyl/3-hydroxydecanoyl-(acyl carrier protein) dehydratase
MMRSALSIAAEHPAYAGHFPAFPVLPGAVLLDAVFAALREARGIELTEWQIASAKFLKLVRPGDALIVEHEAPDSGTIRFTVRSDELNVATGTLCRCATASAA